TQVRPHDIRDHCCVVVGTIQTLRVSNTEGRKVYAHNEDMEPHFTAVPRSLPGLEKRADGGIKFSFANLMHLHRPLMIVDEAHNAVSGLSREMQARVNPSAIIEFTATPHLNSNILHSVTAQELKAEEMIKLPIMLSEHTTWQTAVNGAIAERARLAQEATKDPGYIRPIVLFQAQQKNQEVTVDVLKKHLVEVENIPETRIAVATGDQRELDGIDLFDPKCPIEYVITMEALKEGWDCSFAYVFCSVSRIQSATDVEQLLGRVLRMPYARRRRSDALNRAYAFLSEPSFSHAAQTLVDKLVSMGFQEDEARESIEVVQQELYEDDTLFAVAARPQPTFTHTVEAAPELILQLEQHEGVTVQPAEDGRVRIAVAGRVDDALAQAIAGTVEQAERARLAEAIARHNVAVNDRLSPAQRGETFAVPALVTEIQGTLELVDTELLIEDHEWSLLDHSPRLGEDEFSIRETASTFEVDLDGNRVTWQYADQEEQLALNVDVEGWTPQALVLWLDRQVRQPDIHQVELLRWLGEMVRHLHNEREMPMAALMRCKFILARKVRERLARIRLEERKSVYQRQFLAPQAKVEVSFDEAFHFRDGMYRDQPRHRGSWKPAKHFLGPDQLPRFDGAADGEEAQCAQALDTLPGVRFWIRNVSRHPSSFWLPTSSDRFYPDFVAQLDDGRLLVVEYKGAHLADSADTDEKRTIGLLWERMSGGKALFIVVEKAIDGKNMRAQLAGKVGLPDAAVQAV
ncbi:MAG TPA: hypothetical protein VF142_20870, partial [Longimicrobium sp.]